LAELRHDGSADKQLKMKPETLRKRGFLYLKITF
jgi:hypothetical protein